MNADPFGVPGRDSRAEPPCTVGAARPPARERVREWLLPVMTIFTTVFATTNVTEAPVVTDQRLGAIGVDLNADHLAVAETDASGNYVKAFSVPLVTYGKNTHQAEALIGDVVAGIVQYAQDIGSPSSLRSWTFARRRPFWKASPVSTAGCCRLSATARSKHTSSPAATVRELRYTR